MSSPKLEVTDISVRQYQKGNMLGYAEITLNGALVIKGCRVFNNNGRIEVVPPARKTNTGSYESIVKFDRKYLEKEINERVIEELKDSTLLSSEALKENTPAKIT